MFIFIKSLIETKTDQFNFIQKKMKKFIEKNFNKDQKINFMKYMRFILYV